jgi:hypothetical protein
MMRSSIRVPACKAAEALPGKKTTKKRLDHPRIIEDAHLLIRQRIDGVKSFNMSYKPVHAYSLTAWPRAIDKIDATSLDIYNRRWNTRTDSLWWSAIAYKAFASKRTVRSYATRKLRVAFVESLKKKGFAPDGARLPSAIARFGTAPLFGTAQLTPDLPILETKMKDLVLETDKAVQRILNFQDRLSPGSSRNGFPPGRGRGGGPNPARDNRIPFKQEVNASLKQFTIRRH